MGSLHEFATALESGKVVGVLLGSGGLADFIPELLQKVIAPGAKDILFDTDPKRLVYKVIATLDKKNAKFTHDGTDNNVKEAEMYKRLSEDNNF
jgi:hypothetical protein